MHWLQEGCAGEGLPQQAGGGRRRRRPGGLSSTPTHHCRGATLLQWLASLYSTKLLLHRAPRYSWPLQDRKWLPHPAASPPLKVRRDARRPTCDWCAQAAVLAVTNHVLLASAGGAIPVGQAAIVLAPRPDDTWRAALPGAAACSSRAALPAIARTNPLSTPSSHVSTCRGTS